MTTNAKITRGPNAFDMAVHMFRPVDLETVSFQFDNDTSHGTAASIDVARRQDADGNEWELELFLPFTNGYRLKVHYNCHTRQGEVLEVLEEPIEDAMAEVSDRDMHRAFAEHGKGR